MIDSEADISAISTKYEKDIIKRGGKIPIVPLSGLSIHNTIGDKVMKVDKQVIILVEIVNTIILVAYIVIPHLNVCGIIGNDFLETHKTKLTLRIDK